MGKTIDAFRFECDLVRSFLEAVKEFVGITGSLEEFHRQLILPSQSPLDWKVDRQLRRYGVKFCCAFEQNLRPRPVRTYENGMYGKT